jgi:hypothetical protein
LCSTIKEKENSKWPNARNMDAHKLFEVEDLEANRQDLTSYECMCMCYHGAKT